MNIVENEDLQNEDVQSEELQTDDLKFMPRREACRGYVADVVKLFEKGSFNAIDTKSDLLFLQWLDEFTKSEVILMGFAVGANLRDGEAASLVKYQEHNYHHDDFIDDLAEWYHGRGATRAKRSTKGAAYQLIQQNYGIVTQQLSEFPNVVAFCGAMQIASEMESVVADLIEIIEKYSDEFVE